KVGWGAQSGLAQSWYQRSSCCCARQVAPRRSWRTTNLPLRPLAAGGKRRRGRKALSAGGTGANRHDAARRADRRQSRKDAAEIDLFLSQATERAGFQSAEGELVVSGEGVTSSSGAT